MKVKHLRYVAVFAITVVVVLSFTSMKNAGHSENEMEAAAEDYHKQK